MSYCSVAALADHGLDLALPSLPAVRYHLQAVVTFERGRTDPESARC